MNLKALELVACGRYLNRLHEPAAPLCKTFTGGDSVIQTAATLSASLTPPALLFGRKRGLSGSGAICASAAFDALVANAIRNKVQGDMYEGDLSDERS